MGIFNPKKCSQCESSNLSRLINLGNQPWCNDYSLKKNKLYPLKVVYCRNCLGSQLTYQVKKENMFQKNYYLSGDNIELLTHFKKLTNEIKKKFIKNKSKKNVLDIGSNDGSFLENFRSDWDVLGIDPSQYAFQISKKKRIKTIKNFFNYNFACKLNKEFDLIHASGVFFHLEQLISCIKGVKKLLKTKGKFIIQFINFKDIIYKNQFDQIYHEHLYYYNIESLEGLLNRFDLEITEYKNLNIHGGSSLAIITHRGIHKKTSSVYKNLKIFKRNKKKFISKIEKFESKIQIKKEKFLKILNRYKKKNYSIYILGVPAKASTIINYYKIDESIINCAFDVNRYKIGNNVPGTKIRIYDENKLNKISTKDIFLILSWNYKYTIIKKFKNKFGKKFKYFLPH